MQSAFVLDKLAMIEDWLVLRYQLTSITLSNFNSVSDCVGSFLVQRVQTNDTELNVAFLQQGTELESLVWTTDHLCSVFIFSKSHRKQTISCLKEKQFYC